MSPVVHPPIFFAGVAPPCPELQIGVPATGEMEVRNYQASAAFARQPNLSDGTPRLVCGFGPLGSFEYMATHGGFAPLVADYPLPQHVMMGLPMLPRGKLEVAFAGPMLRGREIEPDPAEGDIIMDWSDNTSPDAVLVTKIRNEVFLCFHYQLSSQRWLGLSLRNVPIPIMGERRQVGVVQREEAGRPIDWRSFLQAQFGR